MERAAIHVNVDSNVINQLIIQRIDEQIQVQIHWVDIERLETMTSMKYRFLHDNFLQHPSVQQFERTKSRKKYYRYPEVIHAINALIERW